MNIQIFGKSKCFNTKKAQRFFKERGVKFQYIDLLDKGMSSGEFDSVLRSAGDIEKLIDEGSKGYFDIKYLVDEAKKWKLLERPELFRTPIVRSGQKATVGYQPEIWKSWLDAD